MAVATDDQVKAALERDMGITVTSIARQTRWRPAWFVEAERDGAPLPLVVRGERVDTFIQPLEAEVRFHQIMEDSGLPVPHIHQWINELGAVVLEMVPGVPHFDGTSEADRDQVVDEYLQALARLHRLDIAPFVDAGVMRALSPDKSAVEGHLLSERLFREKKRWPHPFMEFALGWFHRNPPESKGRESAIVWDSGQFHHQGGHMVAILDLEFGHIGDPMMDLAIWRMRDTLIPFGDFRKLYARYAELSGEAVDIEAIKRHHFAATIANELMFGPPVIDPVAETDLMNNMQWNSETNLHATEFLGEFLDIDLPTVEMPAPRRMRSANTYKHLVDSLKGMRTDEDSFLQHDIRLAFRTARHLERVAEIGDAVEQANLDDIFRVTDRKVAGWREGEQVLEDFVLADRDRGTHDRELVWLFHRRNLRTHMMMGPPGSKMVEHFPCQRFDGRPSVNTAVFV